MTALTAMDELDCQWHTISHVDMAMRRKVVVNAVINPLTALLNCRNGDLFTSPAAGEISKRVCEEAAQAYGAQIKSETADYLDNLAREGYDPESVDTGRLPAELSAASLEKEVQRVARVTKNNFSSMLKHIHRGTTTEIEYINGYLLRMGALHGVPMPTTQTLYDLARIRSDIPLDQMI